MGKPAARLTDMHVCPMVNGMVPHVGGPITGPGAPTVLIGGLPAAVMGDLCTCTGPPDTIILGSTGVMIGGKPAARMGDQTAHGGSIVLGCMTVLIGEVSPGVPSMGLMEAAMAGALQGFPATAAFSGAAAGASSVMPSSATLGAAAGGSKARPKDRSWFQAEVTFKDGSPARGVPYRLVLPDGTERAGTTDERGMVREGGVPKGECKFSLVELDKDAWDRKR